MEAAKTYITEFWQSELVQSTLHQIIAFLLSFVDMNVVHDEVFLIIFAILVFIGFFFLLAVFTKGIYRVVSIVFAFLMMIGAMTIYASVGTGLLQVQFDEEKLQARAELERKKQLENQPPQTPPAVKQRPLAGEGGAVKSGSNNQGGNDLGLPENDQIHWEVYDPYEKPQDVNSITAKTAAGQTASTEQQPKVQESPEKKAERARIGRELAMIEGNLAQNTGFIDETLAEIDKRLQKGEIDEVTALAQKARWGIEKQSMVLEAMDEKAAVLSQADLLTDSDKANDLRKVNARRQQASDRLTEYQNVLQQVEENKEILQQAMW